MFNRSCLRHVTCRCAGDVLIIEVNRPPTSQSCVTNDDVTKSPSRSRRSDVIGESSPGVVSQCLDQAEGPPSVTSGTAGRRRMDDECVYVELDVDCAAAVRQNNIIASSKYDQII